jgi:hypothetical protein
MVTALVFMLGHDEPTKMEAHTPEERAQLRRVCRDVLRSGDALQVCWTAREPGQPLMSSWWGADWSGGTSAGRESSPVPPGAQGGAV